MRLDAPGDIDGVLDEVDDKYGVVIPLSDFLYADPYAVLTEGVLYGEYLGLHTAGGVLCHHLSFSQEDIDWQLWIDAGDRPLPRKLVITYRGVPDSTADHGPEGGRGSSSGLLSGFRVSDRCADWRSRVLESWHSSRRARCMEGEILASEAKSNQGDAGGAVATKAPGTESARCIEEWGAREMTLRIVCQPAEGESLVELHGWLTCPKSASSRRAAGPRWCRSASISRGWWGLTAPEFSPFETNGRAERA